ncbi:MAG TPA: sulfatase-like hydrolase/transferase [Planctomycetota bacterium]|nr:sulfatase-like hydrolase/transferase [Planctomycetota bacterium]
MSHARSIVIICTDQQRYDSLGCTGNPHALSQNIDALSRESSVFHRHITTSPVCMPSRASFFTGRYPNGHGVWLNGVELPRRREVEDANCSSHVPTLADVFLAAGYHTRSVGKLHFSPYLSPARLDGRESLSRSAAEMESWRGPYYGFEHVSLTLGHGEFHRAGHYRTWLRRNFPEIDKRLDNMALSGTFPEARDVHPGIIPAEAHHSTWIGTEACEFLASKDAAERPFLLYVSFPDPHHPYTPPPELAREFEQRDVMPWHRGSGLEDRPSAWRTRVASSVLDDACLRRVRQYTDAMIHLIDRNVGRILATLKEQGLYEDTTIVYTSDHGDFLGDFGLLRKNFVACNALNHVPFILRAPGQDLPAQTRVPMSNADVLPTLCDLHDVPLPAGVQGRSILPALRGESAHAVPVFAYHSDPQFHNFTLYDERYRFTLYPGTGERELYDHTDDPHELRNRANDPVLKAVESRMREELLELHLRSDTPSGGRVCDW